MTQREAFEAWYVKAYHHASLEQVENGCYLNLGAGMAWDAWTAAQAQAAVEPVAWMHDCAALCANDVELWIDRCPHCGKPRTSPPDDLKFSAEEAVAAIRALIGKEAQS